MSDPLDKIRHAVLDSASAGADPAEFNALLAADGKAWQSAAPPRWRQTHAP